MRPGSQLAAEIAQAVGLVPCRDAVGADADAEEPRDPRGETGDLPVAVGDDARVENVRRRTR
jgi:hypothetical protein